MTPSELQQKLRAAQSHHQSGRLAEAEKSYLELAEAVPPNADLWHLLGVLAYQQGDPARAIPRYEKAIELKPEFFQAHNNLALALKSKGDLDAATKAFNAALQANPGYAEAAYNLALLHEAAGDKHAAETAYRQALTAKPDWPAALGNLGNLLRGQNRLAEAEPFIQRSYSARPADADAIGNLALLRIDQGRLLEGRTLAERAAKAYPSARWWEAAGSAARLMKDFDGAVTYLHRAVELAPGDAALWFELGLALEASGADADARSAIDNARSIAPNWERLRWAQGLLLPRIVESEAAARSALERFDANLRELEEGLRLDTPERIEGAFEAACTTLPFQLHYLQGDHFERQGRFGDLVARVARARLPAFSIALERKPAADPRIRVGFVSAYLRHHVVERYFGAFIRELDPARFERHVWFTADDADVFTQEIEASVEHFHASNATVPELAAELHGAGLDVLVYPDIGLDPRQGVLASLRLAPVQIALAGHPVTSGIDSVDYFAGGDAIEPAGAQSAYREKLVRLPALGAAPRPPSPPGDARWARALRIEGRALVMCLQNLSKISPSFDATLADIVARTRARLVFFDRGGELSDRFRVRFERALAGRGVEAVSFHVEPVHGYRDFLAGIAQADLIVDTPGFSGGATSLDALGVGVPILAFDGEYARGRQTAAMLKLLGCDDLIARDGADYASRAVALLKGGALGAVRARIASRAPALFQSGATIASFAEFLASCAGGSVPD